MNLDQLSSELTAAGIRGARHRRIVAEFADHLHENPAADLGAPEAIARQFADELGTSFARRAALAAFAALAVAGILVAARGASLMPFTSEGFGPADTVSLLVALLAGQVAFAAGSLGVLRAWRLRRSASIPRREATVLARRAGVGLAAGAVTVLAMPLGQVVRIHGGATNSLVPGWWWAGMIVSLVALATAAPALLRAARLRPLAGGSGGDLLADLGPVGAPARTPTRFALLFAAALVVLVAAAGVVADDPYDGILRGLVEGGACFGGYLVLGRYLGLK